MPMHGHIKDPVLLLHQLSSFVSMCCRVTTLSVDRHLPQSSYDIRQQRCARPRPSTGTPQALARWWCCKLCQEALPSGGERVWLKPQQAILIFYKGQFALPQMSKLVVYGVIYTLAVEGQMVLCSS